MGKLKVIGNELVPVYETDKGQKVVYGTELHAALEVKTAYKDWSTRRFNECDAAENKDYEVLLKNERNSKGGRPSLEHIIRLDIAKEMAMLERNDKGKQVRRYFIKIEEEYKETITKGRLQQFDWRETRQAAKETRISETDSIKAFVAYAEAQGSQHAYMYYYHLTDLAHKAAGITDGRDKATVYQLSALMLIEHAIAEIMQEDMAQNKPYRAIYQDCKDKIRQFVRIAYLDYQQNLPLKGGAKA